MTKEVEIVAAFTMIGIAVYAFFVYLMFDTLRKRDRFVRLYSAFASHPDLSLVDFGKLFKENNHEIVLNKLELSFDPPIQLLEIKHPKDPKYHESVDAFKHGREVERLKANVKNELHTLKVVEDQVSSEGL